MTTLNGVQRTDVSKRVRGAVGRSVGLLQYSRGGVLMA